MDLKSVALKETSEVLHTLDTARSHDEVWQKSLKDVNPEAHVLNRMNSSHLIHLLTWAIKDVNATK